MTDALENTIAPDGREDSDERDSMKTRRANLWTYRHFHTVHPVANKYLGSKWDQDQRRIHHEKVKTAKCLVDTTKPKEYRHLQINYKKLQLEEERQADIRHTNEKITQKIQALTKHDRARLSNQPTALKYAHTLNGIRLNKEQTQVEKENQAMADRIGRRGSFYDHADQIKDRLQTLSYLSNIAEYPHRFMDKEKQYETLSRAETERPRESEYVMNEQRRELLQKDFQVRLPEKTHQQSRRVRFPDADHNGSPRSSISKKRAQTPKLPVTDIDLRMLETESGPGRTLPVLPDIGAAPAAQTAM
ncbi:Ubiquitin-protein ligase [Gaertneriomyces sp. JEL0708]|nr:Ubiquitin-protein ligase [Gaertneriomyces sp. JEL0708]